jgi:hypothetical protein
VSFSSPGDVAVITTEKEGAFIVNAIMKKALSALKLTR